MVKHIIIWNFKEELSAEERRDAAAKIKLGLEALIEKIDGIVAISVKTAPLSSSNSDLMLDSTFVDEAALIEYRDHPEHLKVATFVRSVMGERKCFDFAEN